MKKNFLFILLLLAVLAIGAYLLAQSARQSALQNLRPYQQANESLQTQVSALLNPTPTLIPDPATYIYEVRSLARLETIHFSVEKIITAEIGQDALAALFGDKLLFVAHGSVLAGIDLAKMQSSDLRLEGDTLLVRLPEAEIFATTLDNEKSYVYDRETGLLTKGDPNLETAARQLAEQEILKAALEDNILEQARQNAELFLQKFFGLLGYSSVKFE